MGTLEVCLDGMLWTWHRAYTTTPIHSCSYSTVDIAFLGVGMTTRRRQLK